MAEVFGIAAFRSRQQVLRLEAAARSAGIEVRVINTPRAVAAGCGLSVRFSERDLAGMQALLRAHRYETLIGLYRVDMRGGRSEVTVYARN